MLRYLAVSTVAVAGLLTVATAPAEAGSTTGTWKYWNPYMAKNRERARRAASALGIEVVDDRGEGSRLRSLDDGCAKAERA
jgi:hypothetical protein